jgi:hypothetical protein
VGRQNRIDTPSSKPPAIANHPQFNISQTKTKGQPMKRITVLALVISVLIPAVSMAEDVLISTKASKVLADKVDKNGQPFSVIFIQEERTLSGVAYTADTPVFAMGPAKDEATKVAAGEAFKAIVSKRITNGDVTYTLRKVIK